MKYPKQAILEGQRIQREKQETPASFATAKNLDRPLTRTRMAGERGARAIELMEDPAAQQLANEWMNLFNMTPTGMQFSGANMGMEQGAV